MGGAGKRACGSGRREEAGGGGTSPSWSTASHCSQRSAGNQPRYWVTVLCSLAAGSSVSRNAPERSRELAVSSLRWWDGTQRRL